MGLEIQNSINSLLNTAAAAATMGKHVKQQAAGLAAADAADQETVATTKKAIEADQFEAQQAILAHAKDEGLTEEQISKLKENPAYAQELRETTLKENRVAGLQEASERYNTYHDNPIDRIYKTGENLTRAYERLRELDQRIDTTRQLKFDLKSAEQRIEARKNRNLFNLHNFKEVE